MSDLIACGCDLGLSKSGIVLLNDRFEIESQNLIKVKSKGAERLVDIEKAFDSIIRPYFPCDLEIFVEGYAYGAKYQRESLAELGGVIRRYLYLANLSFWVVPPNNIKKFVTGTGKASKNYMKKCTKDQWGQSFKSDDVCDAYGLGRLGMCVLKSLRGQEGYSHLPETQQEEIQNILYHQQFYRAPNTAYRGIKKHRKQNK